MLILTFLCLLLFNVTVFLQLNSRSTRFLINRVLSCCIVVAVYSVWPARHRSRSLSSKPSHRSVLLKLHRVKSNLYSATSFTHSIALHSSLFLFPYISHHSVSRCSLSESLACAQMCLASGTVLGPVVGGVLADTDWRWIFWLNTIPGQICIKRELKRFQYLT